MKPLHPALPAVLGVLLLPSPAALACPPTDFPGAGQRMRVDFDTGAFDLDFKPDRCTLTFTGLDGDVAGLQDTVVYQSAEIAPRVYRLVWSRIDPATNAPFTNVVHIQNWNDNQVHSSFSNARLDFTHRRGPLTRPHYP